MTKPAKPKPSSRPGPVPFSDSVGKTLRRQRLANSLTLDQIAAETKIQKAYLKAIEGSQYEELPHTIHTQGFIRRYARLLKLDDETAVKKYLLERGPMPLQTTTRTRTKLKSPIVGSRLVRLTATAIVLMVIAAYLLWQLRVLAAPPQLKIDQPAANVVLLNPSVVVAGSTTPGANITVNGQSVYVDDAGHWQTNLNLPAGVNEITVVATNSRHQTNQAIRTILIKPIVPGVDGL